MVDVFELTVCECADARQILSKIVTAAGHWPSSAQEAFTTHADAQCMYEMVILFGNSAFT